MDIRTTSKPLLILAPMDDVTDTVFRQIVADCAAPDLYFTEFVNVDGLQSPGREKLLHKLQFSTAEKPIIAQVWGKNPKNFRKTAQEIVTMGFAGIDINMGCPDRTIIKNGCCAALINNRDLALDIIHAVQDGVDGQIPVSVKTRLGFGEIDLTWPALLLAQNLDMLTIHGRTVKQLSKVPADWQAIENIRLLRDKIAPDTKIIGNGDVASRNQAEELIAQHQLDGVMVGRGVFADPFVFSEKSPWDGYTKQQRMKLFIKHVSLFRKTWGKERKTAPLNKFCKIYIQDFAGAKELREQCMRAQNTDELLKILDAALLQ